MARFLQMVQFFLVSQIPVSGTVVGTGTGINKLCTNICGTLRTRTLSSFNRETMSLKGPSYRLFY